MGEDNGGKGGRVVKEHVCIKDTWTKPKGGRIEVGGGDSWGGGQSWGGNGDNCT